MSEDEDEKPKSAFTLLTGVVIGLLLGLPLVAVGVVFVAVVLIVALSVLGNNLSQEFNYIGSTIATQSAATRAVEEVKPENLEELLADEEAEEPSPDDAGDDGTLNER